VTEQEQLVGAPGEEAPVVAAPLFMFS
jgi:hypothetical protein